MSYSFSRRAGQVNVDRVVDSLLGPCALTKIPYLQNAHGEAVDKSSFIRAGSLAFVKDEHVVILVRNWLATALDIGHVDAAGILELVSRDIRAD